MTETATVLKTTGKIAVVRIEKKPECDGCKVCAFKNGQSTVKVKALNTCGAKAGDTVVVKAEKDNRALASFIVYIVPVLLAGAGVLVGALCFEREAWIALLSVAGLVLGFAAVFAADKLLARSRGFGMEAVEICDTNAENKEEEENGQNV